MLAALDAPLRAAAFGDSPGLAPMPLLAARCSRESAWLAAVVLGAAGRYAAAAALLEPVRRARSPVLASLAASTLASHRRQLGGHGVAVALDAAALHALAGRTGGAEDPDGVDVAGARHDALLGLAADAVGLGRPERARALIELAGRDGPGRRQRVRAGWVAAECALSCGDPVRAVEEAERAEAEARTVGSFRHVIKSRLVLGAALGVDGTQSNRLRARALVETVLQSSLDRGLVSLTWPSARLLGSWDPTAAPRYDSIERTALTCVFRRADPVGRRLMAASPWIPDSLLRTGDGAPANR